jgi:hypothetical protein
VQGAQQFKNLRVLSAADNLLQDLDSLGVLTACSNLQVRCWAQGMHDQC